MVAILKQMHFIMRRKLRRLMTSISVVIGFLTAFFLYVSNITIDEGTAELYRTLDMLAIVFLVIFSLVLISTVFVASVDFVANKERTKDIRKSRLNKQVYPFDVLNFTFMFLFVALSVYPMIYVIAGSFNQGADYAIGGVYLLPRLFTFENYTVVLKNSNLWQGYLVTIGRTVIGTSTALVYTSIVAYAMSRANLKFKGVFYWINILTMFFSGGLIPYFLIIRLLGLYDTFAVYIIPSLYSVYHMIIMSAFFRTVSNELHEAALVDGASEFRIYWQVYMPLSKPVLATIALWLAVGHWNAYFDTMIFTNNPNLQTLQYFLLKAIQTSTMTEGMPAEMMMRLSPKTISLAAIIISVIPVLMFFPFVRKNFQSGIMIGSLKG